MKYPTDQSEEEEVPLSRLPKGDLRIKLNRARNSGKQTPTIKNDKGPVKDRLQKVQPWKPWQAGCTQCNQEVQPFHDGQPPNCPEANVREQWGVRGKGEKICEPDSSEEEEEEEAANEDDITTDELGTAAESSQEDKN